MPKTFTPGADNDFDQWLANFNAALAAHYSEVGLASTDADALDAAVVDWDLKYTTNNAAVLQAKQTTAAKNTSRESVEEMLSPLVTRIQSYPGTTDELREAFGLRPKGAGTTGLELTYLDKPTAGIDINEHLTHNVKVYTMTPTGPKKGKPVGAFGCEVRRKIGDAPSSVEEMEVVGIMSKTSFALAYPAGDAGKQVTYAMRWIPRTGEPGSWSDFQSATIAA